MIEVAGDLWSLLEKRGHPLTRTEATAMSFPRPNDSHTGPGVGAGAGVVDTHGTTVIAVKFDRGVINVGDRRATANFSVMYDRSEKVLPIYDYTLLASSGSFSRAIEARRSLPTTLKTFGR